MMKMDFYLFLQTHKSPIYRNEKYIKNNFNEIYLNILTFTNFPLEFTFAQKLYHYIHNDYELKLGICPECGNRCSFKKFSKGYNTYCSKLCAVRSDDVKNKIIQTTLTRYNVKNPAQSEVVKEKAKRTCLEKYGCEYSFQSDNVRQKSKQTCLEKYGCEYPVQAEEIKEKAKRTCLEKYGCENPSQSEEIKEKVKQTCLKRYGKEFYTQTNEYKDKFNNETYVKIIQQKIFNTKKENNTFKTSKIENQLKTYFVDNNINFISQYKSNLYPFTCDFYFPDKDLYVEIQGSWTHGPNPFTGSDKDIKLLEKWKSKNNKYYNNAIETWCFRDVKKRETAKINKLNYLEIFSINFNFCLNNILQHL